LSHLFASRPLSDVHHEQFDKRDDFQKRASAQENASAELRCLCALFRTDVRFRVTERPERRFLHPQEVPINVAKFIS